jgi:hypothetical protein
MLVKINELCPPNIKSALKQGAPMKSGAPQKNFSGAKRRNLCPTLNLLPAPLDLDYQKHGYAYHIIVFASEPAVKQDFYWLLLVVYCGVRKHASLFRYFVSGKRNEIVLKSHMATEH